MIVTVRLNADHLKEISTVASRSGQGSRPKLLRVVARVQQASAFLLIAIAAIVVLNNSASGYRWIPLSLVGVLLLPTLIVNQLKPTVAPALQKSLGQERVLTLTDSHVIIDAHDIETRVALDHVLDIQVCLQSCVLALKSGGRVFVPVGPMSSEDSARPFFAKLQEAVRGRN